MDNSLIALVQVAPNAPGYREAWCSGHLVGVTWDGQIVLSGHASTQQLINEDALARLSGGAYVPRPVCALLVQAVLAARPSRSPAAEQMARLDPIARKQAGRAAWDRLTLNPTSKAARIEARRVCACLPALLDATRSMQRAANTLTVTPVNRALWGPDKEEV